MSFKDRNCNSTSPTSEERELKRLLLLPVSSVSLRPPPQQFCVCNHQIRVNERNTDYTRKSSLNDPFRLFDPLLKSYSNFKNIREFYSVCNFLAFPTHHARTFRIFRNNFSENFTFPPIGLRYFSHMMSGLCSWKALQSRSNKFVKV